MLAVRLVYFDRDFYLNNSFLFVDLHRWRMGWCSVAYTVTISTRLSLIRRNYAFIDFISLLWSWIYRIQIPVEAGCFFPAIIGFAPPTPRR